jgi:hypothetical protein
MVKVITKNEFGLFYDKSVLDDIVECTGLTKKYWKIGNDLFNNEKQSNIEKRSIEVLIYK